MATPQIIDILNGIPSQQLSVELGDGNLYTFNLSWNSRADFWSVSIDREDDENLIEGLALKAGANLLEPFNFGIGELYCIDASNSGFEMTLYNVGNEVFLVYNPPD